jgi:hypothetical protein
MRTGPLSDWEGSNRQVLRNLVWNLLASDANHCQTDDDKGERYHVNTIQLLVEQCYS